MLCAHKEGGNQCLWWAKQEYRDNLKGHCTNLYASVQIKNICDGTQLQVISKSEEFAKS
jgi:hypothetical protein